RWAFKIVDNSYHGRKATTGRLKDKTNQSEPFPPLTNKISNINLTDKNHKQLDSIPTNKDYVEIEGKYGTILELKLADLFDEKLLNPNNKETLVNRNIIFFAYDKNVGINTSDDIKHNAYCIYNDNDKKGTAKEVYADRITSIELKIIETRFRLEFDGNVLVFLENEREIIHKPARSGMPLNNLKADSKENMERKRFALPDINNQSFYYDLYLHKQDSTKPLEEGKYYLKIENVISLLDYYILNKNNDDLGKYKISLYNDKNMTNTNTTSTSYTIHGGKELGDTKGIDLANNAKDFFEVLKQYVKNTKIAIPLNVQYQKRILITIERFKQTTESTKSRMNIFIDGNRVDSKGNITDKLQNSSLNQTNPYAYILERNGPDCIGGELKLRIPEGRYGVMEWNIETGNETRNNTIKLTNNFVYKDRNILIHNGNTPKNSDGCLLINKKNDDIDDILSDSNTIKKAFYDALRDQNGVIKKYFNGINKDEIIEHIEIRIRNVFEINNDLSGIEIVGKNGLDISLITEYSKNILREIGRDSNNSVITITDVARTPKDQANRMYNMIQQNSINKVKQTYKKQVHSVIDIYEDLANQDKTKTDILNAMEQKIKRLILLGRFQHCQDFDIKNTFDISVLSLKNANKFYEVAKKYEDTHRDFKIIDESKNKEKCYHIEITQPIKEK
ncbi:DUF5675 family protein, partial [Helicobacter sp. T3_23-1059]